MTLLSEIFKVKNQTIIPTNSRKYFEFNHNFSIKNIIL